MTNEAVLDILNHLCNEARNSVHATFAVLDMLPPAVVDRTWHAYFDIGRSSADRLLRSIDDFRALLSTTPTVEQALEEFDLSLCLGETIEFLNLASEEPSRRILLEAPSEPLPIRQDRQAVEQVLTRILDTLLKLTSAFDVSISVAVHPCDHGARFSITPPESGLAVRLLDWLNADPERVCFRDLPDMPLPVTIMVAGKRLRSLGGTAQIVCDPGAPTKLVVFLPSLFTQPDESRQQEVRLNALKVLITEDCDHSYAVSELLLQEENVWRARNGREAIEMVKKRRFGIVLMDIHLPGMDGYTVIRAIRDWETQTANARTPIVILSADDLDIQRQSAARSGCIGFLRKPLRKNDLLDVLDRLKIIHTPTA
jgi:CheY-like chemotaxis protein